MNQQGDLEKAATLACEKFGGLDIVVANAGFGVAGYFEKLSLEDYRRQFETNVFGLLRTAYATLTELKKSRGSLVLIGSVTSYVSLPGNSAYAMSKFSVRALAQALRHELSPHGVAVTLINPGFVVSEIRKIDNRGKFHAESIDPVSLWHQMPTDTAARHIVRAVAKRKGEEIITLHGKVIVFLERHFHWLVSLLIRRRGIRSRPEPK